MPRSVNAVASRARRKKVLKQTKGYWGRRKNVFRHANNTWKKAYSTLTATAKPKKESFARYGYNVSMPVCVNMTSLTHNLSI